MTGSYYVWIPRYSYRIIYFDTEAHENEYRAGTLTEENALKNNYIIGYSDARGIVDSSGKRPADVTSVTSISVNDKYLRTHPVFDGNVDNGGWDSKLQGIWVMKYEASVISNTLKSIPNVASKTGIKVKSMFNLSINAYKKNGQTNTILNPHMMKNSEWGVIEYLADSKYGRNGTQISGKGAIENLSSTTGNEYGIYDMVGGLGEYVMGFGKDENNNIMFGSTGFTSETMPDKKYYQSYFINDGTTLGDGLYETRWSHYKTLNFSSASPAIWRGTHSNDVHTIFDFVNNNGDVNYAIGFRACLAVK